MVLLSTTTSCAQKGATPIPVTPEVSTPDKKKPKRSAKPKREQPENTLDATIQGHPDPKPALAPNGAPLIKQGYDWDRTPAEDAKRAEDQRISRTPFPAPEAKTLPFDKFATYWNALRERPEGKYMRGYIRRWKPIMLPEEIEDERTGLKRESHPSEKKLTCEDGPLTDQLILEKVGVGDYTIRLNDTRLPWERATVVHCERFATIRDFDHYPPFLDVDRLDWDEDDNQVYIKWGLSKGILHRRDQIGKEQEDMAQASVVETLTSDIRAERARTDQLQEESRRRAEQEARDAKEALARAQATAAQSVKIEDTKLPAPASDLLNVASAMSTMVKALQPEKDNSLSEYLKLQAEREKTERERDKEERQVARDTATAERKRADDLQAEVLKELRDAAKAPPPAAIAPMAPRTDLDLMEEMVKKQALLKQLTGRGGPAEAEEEKPGRIDKWLEAAPVVGPVIQTFLQGLFQSFQYGLQTWQTISYNNALLRNGTTPQPPTTMNQQQPATTAQPGQPQPATAPAPTPEQQAQHQRLVTMLKALEDAANPILVAFSKGESGDSGTAGATFAETIITYKGRPDYDQIRSLGETQQPGVFDLEAFKGAIRFLLTHPNRGKNTAHLADSVMAKPSFAQFLAGFFNYDEIRTEMQRQAEEEGEK